MCPNSRRLSVVEKVFSVRLPTNWSALWWDHGAAQIAVDWAASLAHLKGKHTSNLLFLVIYRSFVTDCCG